MKNSALSPSSKQPLTHKLTVTAMLSAIAFVLMYIEISVPLMPSFIKFDFSDLPELLAAFSLGPVYGVMVCLIKNLVHLPVSNSFMIGELSNFLIGSTFAFTAGLIYQKRKDRTGALSASLVGALVMALVCLPVNYYIVYPLYTNFMPMETIIGAYHDIYSGVNNLWDCLLIFNAPFTLVKGLIDVALTFLIYKKISPILHK